MFTLSLVAVALGTKYRGHEEPNEHDDGGAVRYFLLPFREMRTTLGTVAPIVCGLITEASCAFVVSAVWRGYFARVVTIVRSANSNTGIRELRH